ncbi:MAG: M15 family metallopeptidase, partial [Gammaproteobacteria bacterium]
ELDDGQELDMGTKFDFFDPLSHTASSRVSESQRENRLVLKSVMERNGFKNLKEEWWHYTLRNEPFPDTYFDFKVK